MNGNSEKNASYNPKFAILYVRSGFGAFLLLKALVVDLTKSTLIYFESSNIEISSFFFIP